MFPTIRIALTAVKQAARLCDRARARRRAARHDRARGARAPYAANSERGAKPAI